MEDMTGLNLADLDVLPHYSKFLKRFDGFEEICSRYEKKKGCEVIRLNDGDGVIVDGEIRIVRRVGR